MYICRTTRRQYLALNLKLPTGKLQAVSCACGEADRRKTFAEKLEGGGGFGEYWEREDEGDL